MTRLQMICAALRLKNTTAAEKIVLIQLASVARKSCVAEMSQARIASSANLSIRTVEQATSSLSSSGYIEPQRAFHKLTGYKMTNLTKLSFAKPSFCEPSKDKRLTAKSAGWPTAKYAGHYNNREPRKLAGGFKIIDGGVS